MSRTTMQSSSDKCASGCCLMRDMATERTTAAATAAAATGTRRRPSVTSFGRWVCATSSGGGGGGRRWRGGGGADQGAELRRCVYRGGGRLWRRQCRWGGHALVWRLVRRCERERARRQVAITCGRGERWRRVRSIAVGIIAGQCARTLVTAFRHAAAAALVAGTRCLPRVEDALVRARRGRCCRG